MQPSTMVNALSPHRSTSRQAMFLVALCLGGLALAVNAMAAEPSSLTFAHTPNNPNVQGWVNVSLDNAGNWSQVETTVVPWRFTLAATWDDPPPATYVLNIQIKPASLPEPPGPSCEGALCQASVGHTAGYVAQGIAPYLNSEPKIVTVDAPLGKIDVAPGIFQTVTGFCHTASQSLLNNGANLHDLLADGFVTDGTAMVATLVYVYGGGGIAEAIPIPFKVRCKGDPAIADLVAPKTNYQGSFATGFQVTGAKLSISPAYKNLTADCPVTVPLVAEFTATNVGNLQFRFVSASGKVSQTYPLSITGKTGGVYKAVYEQQIQVPLTPASGMGGGQGGGGGVVNQQPGSGLAIQTQPEEPIVPGSPPSGGMGQVQVNPLAGNIHSESFRVEVVSPATGIISGYAGYRITCKPKATPGISGPSAMQMQPTPTQPAQQQAQARALPGAVGGLTSGLKADIMGTTLGFLLGSPHPWGSTIVIDKPQQAAATGVGPRRNLCRFTQAGYRPFNKGDIATGPFKNRVYRGSQTVDQSIHNLAPKQTDGWRTFALDLPSGLSVIRVVMDSDKQVDESNENNTFSVRVDVKLDCTGPRRGKVAPLQRIAPTQPRLPQRN